MSTNWQEGLWRILLKRSKNFWTTISSMCTISSTRKLSTKTLSSNHHKIFRYTYGFFFCEFLNIIILVGQVKISKILVFNYLDASDVLLPRCSSLTHC